MARDVVVSERARDDQHDRADRNGHEPAGQVMARQDAHAHASEPVGHRAGERAAEAPEQHEEQVANHISKHARPIAS
jgi:hypothetical protein